MELPSAKIRKKNDFYSHSFSVGDNVEVCEGELIYLQGKVLSIDGSIITMMPNHRALKVSTTIIKLILLIQNKGKERENSY